MPEVARTPLKNKGRQGDILLRRISKLPPMVEQASDVIAEGETTGHMHRIKNAQVFRSGSQLYVQVERPDAIFVHDEHWTEILTPGVFEVVNQREYQPSGMTHRMAD